ncbi:uncharacterized protein LOC120084863 [Benincasa hispida]|uniref:uncharacterized protein LOC120084863 n=1 Tax=Benincasa hispida TaxID=102211 RepID=UPI0018FF37C1|nr:uncharacterized protein LOC120084863 [Benincasa hispida]
MVNIPVVVFYGGQCTHYNSYEYSVVGVFVDDLIDFNGLVSLILDEIQLDVSIDLSGLLDFGQTNIQSVFQIKQDKDISWYWFLAKDSGTRHPLVAHVSHHFVEGSCSGISGRGGDRLLCLGSSSCSSNDQVIQNVGFNGDLKEKDVFGSKEILCKCFDVIAVNKNFQFRTTRSNSKSFELKCLQEGCQWYVRASWYKKSELWMLRKYISDHNCLMNTTQSCHRQASSSVIGDYLKEDFRFISTDHSLPRDIVYKARTKLGVNISYQKAWRVKEHILRSLNGDAAKSYSLIPQFFQRLKEMNPGTHTALKIDENGHFKLCFMVIGASIEGWRYSLPTISVDGTFLKYKFGGTLLSASTLDGNNNIFPLAFAIVDSENDVSWKWFFEHIQTSLGDREHLVIVSYRHLSIPKDVLSVFNNVEYYMCIQHVLRNLKLFKDPLIDQFYFSCAKSYTIDDFEFNMRSIESISPNIRSYLINVGLKKWSRAYSQRRRYEMMTTNPSECVNFVLKENRNLPVASLLDAIRCLLQKWFHDRRKASLSMTTILTPWAENILHNQHEQSRSFMIHPIEIVEYSVMDGDKQFLVKLNFESCSLQVWDFEEIPCSHVLVVLRLLNMDIYSYISNYYYSSALSWTYMGCVRPVGVHSNWRVLDDGIRALPPIFKHSARRPKKQRIPSVGEAKSSSLRCSRCHSKGHNSRTCKLHLISQ